MTLGQAAGSLATPLGYAPAALAAAVAAWARPKEVARQFYSAYVNALPLALISGAALGSVIWMHIHGLLLRAPGYTQLLPQFLAAAVVLEIAPLTAGLIVAGRSGASLASELGAMRQTEQIDAMEAMGVSPVRYLVGPRLWACALATPLLTIMVGALAIAAGYVAEIVAGDMTWREYWDACLLHLRLTDVLGSLGKTFLFGFLIAGTSCYEGLSAREGAAAIGRAATRGVVKSMLMVVAADVVMVKLIQSLT
jgi:phospholipid/cholesterol/gamma-HCH transport system permease protein